MKKENLYQHGDVYLNRVEIDLAGAQEEKPKKGCLIVAEGELTGHAHRVKEKEAIICVKDGKRYILTEEGFTITHEEHKPITVTPGTYEIGFVQEFDYFTGESKNVAD